LHLVMFHHTSLHVGLSLFSIITFLVSYLLFYHAYFCVMCIVLLLFVFFHGTFMHHLYLIPSCLLPLFLHQSNSCICIFFLSILLLSSRDSRDGVIKVFTLPHFQIWLIDLCLFKNSLFGLCVHVNLLWRFVMFISLVQKNWVSFLFLMFLH